jgi:NADH:ubiquinone oxidoreductase subunit 6 (subunit J)
MAEKETKDTPSESSDIRYKYIGFDVYGSKVKEFFRSEEEKKEHEKQVAEYAKSHSSSLRSGTAVKAELLSRVDRVILTLSSLVLISGGVLPWFSVNSIYGKLTMPGITLFSSAASFMGLLSRFAGMLPVLVYIFSALAAIGVVFGILTLVMLYLPSGNRDRHLARLRHVLGWQYLPLTVWVATFVFLIVGVKIPFGEDLSNIYAIPGLGSKFDIVTFWAFAQPALWLSVGSLVINAVKSNDL